MDLCLSTLKSCSSCLLEHGLVLVPSEILLGLSARAICSRTDLVISPRGRGFMLSTTSSSSSSSSATSTTENTLESNSESRSSQVGTSTLRSQVGTSTPQASTSIPHGNALGDIKDEAKDKFDEDTWFTADEKRNKMTKESMIELLEEFPLHPPFSAGVPALQEHTNYDTDLETSVYEGQIKSGYRILMHPFAVAFFNYYKMAPGQLVPNGWRKLVGLIYLVQTSEYPVTVHDFMRLYLEVCFIKNVAKSVGWYYIHNRVGVIKGGPKSNKGWHSRGGLNIDENLTDQEMRHAGLIPPVPTIPVPPTPIIKSRKASKGKRKEGTGEGSSPVIKRPRAPTPTVPQVVIDDLPIDKDPIFHPRWTIKKGDSGMPSLHVSAQHLAHGVLPSDKLILENQSHEAFAMAHVQAAYNTYCYSSQMQDRFTMAMDMADNAETEKRAAVGKADKLDKEVKDLKTENMDLLTKLGLLEKRCEKLRHEKAEVRNKAIQAFLDGTAGEEWLRKRTEEGLSIFHEGFQKAKELTMAKYSSLFIDDVVVPTFESPSGETVAPTEAGDAISPGGEKHSIWECSYILGQIIFAPLFYNSHLMYPQYIYRSQGIFNGYRCHEIPLRSHKTGTGEHQTRSTRTPTLRSKHMLDLVMTMYVSTFGNTKKCRSNVYQAKVEANFFKIELQNNVVDIDKKIGNNSILGVDEEQGIGNGDGLGEADLNKVALEFLIRFMKLTDIMGQGGMKKARRLSHADVIMKGVVQEGIVDVKLPKRPVLKERKTGKHELLMTIDTKNPFATNNILVGLWDEISWLCTNGVLRTWLCTNGVRLRPEKGKWVLRVERDGGVGRRGEEGEDEGDGVGKKSSVGGQGDMEEREGQENEHCHDEKTGQCCDQRRRYHVEVWFKM
ncbi:hypothetical protein RJ640_024657 [Escallonia rubra]|uniref:Transposase (putative) gypsy type domain-containing protein n=1 Tax=Escallonia rubra TaxID=112253 RepID=A0AA88R5N4_9ASTE|nr:hypothetical protein RJ640_024657 [Escallonia rubra]